MPIIRLVLLLGLAGGLFLLVQFNWSPLALVFLGIQTPALPLALWILGAIVGGVITNLLITSLFSLSNFFAVRSARLQVQRASRRTGFQARSTPSPQPATSYSRSSTTRAAEDDAAWNNWEGYEEPVDRPSSSARSAVDNEPIDDWETDPNDDWDDEPRDASVNARSATSRDRTDYEAKQSPTTSSRSGSVYSYGYRDPKGSGVGKAEPVVDKPVVDADFRVIVPPYRSLDEDPIPEMPEAPLPEESADDWFEDGDDFEDGDGRTRSRRL